jgi:hypothetical protein
MHGRVSTFVSGSNIKEGNFVCAFLVVSFGNFHWVARIADIQKLHTFYNTAVVYIKAGNNSFR